MMEQNETSEDWTTVQKTKRTTGKSFDETTNPTTTNTAAVHQPPVRATKKGIAVSF